MKNIIFTIFILLFKIIIFTIFIVLTISTKYQTKNNILKNVNNKDSFINISNTPYIKIPNRLTNTPNKDTNLQLFKKHITKIERVDSNTIILKYKYNFINYKNIPNIKSSIKSKSVLFVNSLNVKRIKLSDSIFKKKFNGTIWKKNK